MKVKVKAPFVDKVTREFYKVGQMVEIEDASRVANLTDRKLVEAVKTETADKTPKKTKK